AQSGVVTSTSMIVNLEAFFDGAARARECRELSVGLHLNLTTGRPLTAAPSLTRPDTGEFHSLPGLLARASLGLVSGAEVARECRAQIDRLMEAGFWPTHLDSHRHVHAHPALWSAVSSAAAARGIPNVRVPFEPLWANPRDWRASLKKAGLLMSGRLFRESARRSGVNHFFGISLQGGASFGERLFALIPQLPPGTSELMTHPGHVDSALAGYDGYTWQREQELTVLRSDAFRDLLENCAIELARFDRAPRTPGQSKIAQYH
ncbi:MAG TPA: ChbG/HpnK family deacetylase, partial [Gemmatimonadaceae bacterium]|nr:ChbG/HpnK family deacetylase [Gemmatimonadaceae bacterium]